MSGAKDAKTQELAIIKSLKWIAVHTEKEPPNTFPYVVNVYVTAAILLIEQQIAEIESLKENSHGSLIVAREDNDK